MANVTIPNLTSATTIAPSTDLMVLEQTEGTRKATLSQIFTSSATSGSGLGITSGGVYTIKTGLDSDITDINTLLGSTSIASIGDGTVTGAISRLNTDLTAITHYILYQGMTSDPTGLVYIGRYYDYFPIAGLYDVTNTWIEVTFDSTNSEGNIVYAAKLRRQDGTPIASQPNLTFGVLWCKGMS